MPERSQWTWAIVPGGEVWHAYADDAAVRAEDGKYKRRQAACGIWRRRGVGESYFGHVPPGPTCQECRALWDERYVYAC